MALSETKVVDQITVAENGTVSYREATRVFRDGEQIAQTYHRTTLTPGRDLTGHPENVVAVATAAWTPEIVAAYEAVQAAAAAARENGR